MFRLSNSEQMLGLVGFVAQIPLIAFGLVAGVLADRWDRRRGLLVTQIVAFGQAVLLAVLTVGGVVKPWHIIALAFVIGSANAFDLPLRHAFLIELVGPANLRNAIALNSMFFNVSRILGPAFAGVLVASLGEGPCFLINALTFTGIISVLSKLRSVSPKSDEKRQSAPVWKSLKEGLALAWSSPHMRNPLVLLMCCGMIVAPVLVLLPAVVARLLNGGPKTLGLMFSCLGAGSLAGAVLLAAGKSDHLLRNIGRAGLLYGVSLLLVAVSRVAWLSCLGSALAGFGVLLVSVGTNTQLQSGVSGELRGRVASLYMFGYFGLAPLGSLLLGFLGQKFGIAAALYIGAGWVLAASAWYMRLLPEMERTHRQAQMPIAAVDEA